jgi:hypothetical protein
MGLGEEVKKLKYDKRLLESNVARGLLSKAEQQKYLADLPDLASNVENLGLVRGGSAGSPAMEDGGFGGEDENA